MQPLKSMQMHCFRDVLEFENGHSEHASSVMAIPEIHIPPELVASPSGIASWNDGVLFSCFIFNESLNSN